MVNFLFFCCVVLFQKNKYLCHINIFIIILTHYSSLINYKSNECDSIHPLKNKFNNIFFKSQNNFRFVYYLALQNLESDEQQRMRFQVELEFVQCLSNPNYLHCMSLIQFFVLIFAFILTAFFSCLIFNSSCTT